MGKVTWPERLYALDVSRALASLAVVLYHWVHFAFDEGINESYQAGYSMSDQPLFSILGLFYQKGSYGVDYFFLLSGFIFYWLYKKPVANRTIGFGKFWIQRFSRLYPLHFATLVIVALLQFNYKGLTGHPFVYDNNDLYHFLLNLTYTYWWGFQEGWAFNHPSWSVSVEVLLYFVFFFAAVRSKYGPLLCLAISAAGFLAFYFDYNRLYLGFAMFFWGGFLFYVTQFLIDRGRQLIPLVYTVALISWGIVLINYYLYDVGSFVLRFGLAGFILFKCFPGYILLSSTLSSLALLEIKRGPMLRSISWMGDITYSTYLLHFPLNLALGTAVVAGVLDSKFYLNPFLLVGYFLFLIPVSYATYCFFERPAQNWIRKRCASRS